MLSTWRGSKVVLTRLRLTTQLLQMAGVEYRSGNVTEFQSLLNEASAIFRSIAAITLDGNGNGSTTPDTTQEPLTPFGPVEETAGPLGTSARKRSASHEQDTDA